MGRNSNYRFITLHNNMRAKVSASDYEWLNKYHWTAVWGETSQTWYATARIDGHNVKMHRLILKAKKGQIVDHQDFNGINNARDNIQIVSASVSRHRIRKPRFSPHGGTPTSKYRGVSWQAATESWYAEITKEGKTYFLGRFDSEIDAAKAFNRKARQLYGKFAMLNKLPRKGGK